MGEVFEMAASLLRGSAARAYVIVLLAVLLFAAAPTVPAQADPQEPDAVVAEIDRFLSAELNEAAIPGAAVAVTRGDQVLMVHGYGHDSTGAAVTGDSLFRIASLSKSFTALAVMQLVDAGLLHLDDPVQDHLPEFQLADPRADQITVRQLLDHTSGLTDAVVPELSRPQPKPRPRRWPACGPPGWRPGPGRRGATTTRTTRSPRGWSRWSAVSRSTAT